MFTGCSHATSPLRLGGKWTAKIIRCLEDGPRRFSELEVPLRGITPKVLTETLRSMERDGLVTRTVGGGTPPRVDYELSALGRTLLDPMAACCAWAAAHLPELQGAREAYEGPAHRSAS
ncbi:helix-turn-helix domain-containing protein [Streptomyces sp. NPDC005795]|uniref:winged helix-turn-helix transcriptional regulator n=1 Tax=Streptomyces sp. NPDC005795 TaxID=3154677 RepID=UPI0033C7D54C